MQQVIQRVVDRQASVGVNGSIIDGWPRIQQFPNGVRRDAETRVKVEVEVTECGLYRPSDDFAFFRSKRSKRHTSCGLTCLEGGIRSPEPTPPCRVGFLVQSLKRPEQPPRAYCTPLRA